MKTTLLLKLLGLLTMLSVELATAQNQETKEIPFPLPTREMRISEKNLILVEDGGGRDYLLAHQPRDDGYSEALVKFAKTQDKRALSLIENFLSIEQENMHDPFFMDRRINLNRQQLGELYWQIKLQNTTLKQKVATFLETERATELFGMARASGQTSNLKRPIEGIWRLLIEQGEPVIPLIAPVLLDKKNSRHLREAAAAVLMNITDSKATAALLKVADDRTEDASLRDLMIQMLATQGHPRAIEAVLQTLAKGEQGEGTKSEIMTALYSIEKLSKAGVDKAKLEAAVIPYLMAADWNKNSFPAAMVAREVGSEKSIEPLINIFKNGKAPSESQLQMLRRAALTSLGMVCKAAPEKAIPFLIEISYDKDPVNRIAGVQALSRAGHSMAIPILVDLIKKEIDSSALHFEVNGICAVGGEDAIKALKNLRDFAQANQKKWLLKLSEEALLRLESGQLYPEK